MTFKVKCSNCCPSRARHSRSLPTTLNEWRYFSRTWYLEKGEALPILVAHDAACKQFYWIFKAVASRFVSRFQISGKAEYPHSQLIMPISERLAHIYDCLLP